MEGKKILYIGNRLTKHGFSLTTIETLGPLLEDEGFDMEYASDLRNPFFRLLDMILKVIRNRSKVAYVIIDTYSTLSFWGTWVVAQLCRILNMRYIPILHGGNLPWRLDHNQVSSSKIFRNSYCNVAPSNYLSDSFQSRGYDTLMIPNSIEISKYDFRPSSEIKPRLLYVRAFHKIYNPTLAVKLVAELKKQDPETELCMVGPDKDGSMEECKQLVKDLGLSNSVKFTGKLSKEEWHKLARNYCIFINTSDFDNTPVSVIEAMSLGLPVVSTRVGGIPFLIKDKTHALLVEKNNVSEMKEAVSHLVDNPDVTLDLVNNARHLAENFDWTVVKNQWNDLLK